MHQLTWYSISDYCFCAIIGYVLRLLQDRNKTPKPDWLFQLMASLVLSYLAYFMYGFYKINKVPMELFIILLSWGGAFVVTTTDYIAKNGVLIYLRKAAEEFLALTKKDEDEH